MKEHILVTGGTGVLGKQLTRKLLTQGRKIIILCREPQPDIFPEYQSQVSWYRSDVSQPMLGLTPETYKDIAAKTSAVFHLAARTDFNGKSLDEYTPTNINGVKNILLFACESRAHLHHVSTAFVCGRYPKTFQEDSLQHGQKFRNFYEESKFLGERILHDHMEAGQVPITIYRPSIILERSPNEASGKNFGPFTFLDAVLRVLLAARRRNLDLDVIRVVGSRLGALPFVFDDRVADTLFSLSCCQNINSRTFHLVSKHPFPNRILKEIFNDVFGRQVVRYADADEFIEKSQTAAEELIARNTKKYNDYMALSLSFDRRNLEEMLGPHVLPSLNTEELMTAFSLFLAQKKGISKIIEKKDSERQTEKVENYFSCYLPGFFGKPLIKNLMNLNASLWLKVQDVNSWSIIISKGRLMSITPGQEGIFGYTVGAKAFLDVVCGRYSPQEGFFKGQIAIEGDTREALRTATALEEFFRTYPYM